MRHLRASVGRALLRRWLLRAKFKSRGYFVVPGAAVAAAGTRCTFPRPESQFNSNVFQASPGDFRIPRSALELAGVPKTRCEGFPRFVNGRAKEGRRARATLVVKRGERAGPLSSM